MFVDIEVEAIDTAEVLNSGKRIAKVVDYIVAHHDARRSTVISRPSLPSAASTRSSPTTNALPASRGGNTTCVSHPFSSGPTRKCPMPRTTCRQEMKITRGGRATFCVWRVAFPREARRHDGGHNALYGTSFSPRTRALRITSRIWASASKTAKSPPPMTETGWTSSLW